MLGDQAGGTRALAEAAKVLDGTPYAFKWANFQGAAPLFEAQRAGAVDLAPAGDLPVLAAAVGDPTLKIVATRVGSGAQLGILVPADSKLRSVAELKGRTVFVSSARGSISQFQLYGALAEAGLSREDVSVRFVLPVDAFTAFESGRIDVWATFDPYFGTAVQQGARVLRDGTGINSGLGFVTASGDGSGRSSEAPCHSRCAAAVAARGRLGGRQSRCVRACLRVVDPSSFRCRQDHYRAISAEATLCCRERYCRVAAGGG